jgi:flagella basal body P-ring formation protein FlgA
MAPVERLKTEAIKFAESQASTMAGTFEFTIVSQPMLPPHKSESLRFEPSHLSKRELTGRFFAALRVYEGPKLVGTSRVDMEGKWAGKVLQAKEALARKTVPDAGSMEMVSIEGAPPAGALTEFPEGFRLRGPVPLGRILTQADLEPIPLVNTGDQVRLALVSGDISISTDGVARSQGAKGDRIRVELSNRKIVQATVQGEGLARLDWGSHK